MRCTTHRPASKTALAKRNLPQVPLSPRSSVLAVVCRGLPAALLGVVVGCHALRIPADLPLPEDEAASSPTAAESEPRAVKDFPAALGEGAWVVRVAPPDRATTEPQPYWRHAGLEELLALPPDERPVFVEWLAHQNPVVAGNAAIAAARLGEGTPAARLAATVRQPLSKLPVEQRMAMRRAAAEALGATQDPTAVAEIGELLTQYGGSAAGKAVPPLEAELLRALAAHVRPDADGRFAAALDSPAAEVRQAALAAWPLEGSAPLPDAIVRLASDNDPAVRRRALELLAVRKHAEAFTVAERALHDQTLEVRLAAIAALGRLGTPPAQQKLRELLDDRAERTRAVAVEALAACEAWEPVLARAEDESWRVREAVARSLKKTPSEAAAAVAEKLAVDSSSQVSEAVMAAVADWPRPLAARVLLAGLAAPTVAGRQAAAEQLRACWPDCPAFDPTAAPQRRAEQRAAIERKWPEQFSASTQPPPTPTEPMVEATPKLTPETLQAAERALAQLSAATDPQQQRAAEQALAALGPQLEPALAEITKNRPLPERVYTHVLPQVEPRFALLVQLQSTQADESRRAAGELREELAARPLSDLALARLVQIVTPARDPLVWMNVQTALAEDRRPPAVALAQAGLTHPAPEVRRRACAYFAAHPDAGQETLLLASLADEDASVVRAAVEALGSGNTLENPLPVVRLLASREKNLRLAAATALARQGYDSGYDALERLTHEDDPALRRQAAEAMARAPQRRFVPTLIRLLDDQLGVKRAALDALRASVGRDLGQGDEPQPPPMSEQIARWKSWYARGQ